MSQHLRHRLRQHRSEVFPARTEVLLQHYRRCPVGEGNEDRRRFMGLVSELPERFGTEVHTFVLMDNHYHLLVRCRRTSVSEALRWLQTSYSMKFNWAHRRRGHVFQGRFKSVLIHDESRLGQVARYVHLNPVRMTGLGLSKEDQRRARVLGWWRDRGAGGVHPGEKLGRDVQETWGLGAGRGGGSGDAALGLALGLAIGRAVRQVVRRQLWVDGSGREAILENGRQPAGIGGFCEADAGQMSTLGD